MVSRYPAFNRSSARSARWKLLKAFRDSDDIHLSHFSAHSALDPIIESSKSSSTIGFCFVAMFECAVRLST